ncbi:MAG: N-acetylmuramoyl-L-alanine amidase [Rhodospirillales bacterium]
MWAQRLETTTTRETPPRFRGISGNRKRIHAAVWLLGAVFAALLGHSPQAHAERAIISDLRVAEREGSTRLVLDLTSAVEASVFTLTAPDRLVIDLPEVGWRLPSRALPSDVGLLKRLRYGLFKPGVTRIVVDALAPIRLDAGFLMQGVEGDGYRLVLDMGRTGSAQAVAASGQVTRIDGLTRQVAEPLSAPLLKETPQSGGAFDAVIAPPIAEVPAEAAEAIAAPAFQTGALPDHLGLPPRKPQGVAAPQTQQAKLIVIDPGHGGVDPGAIGRSGVQEKHIVLAFARELADQLTEAGYRVKLTRSRDVFIRLRDRVSFAREAGADLFLSIHADKIEDPNIRGLAVYTLSEKASDQEAAALADKENKSDLIAGINLENESEEVANILLDLAQRETMNQSSRFAEKLVDNLKRETKVLRNSHRFAGFRVLKAPDVPSVLVELGFLSNRTEEKNLRSDDYRKRLAQAATRSIDTFFTGVQQANWR